MQRSFTKPVFALPTTEFGDLEVRYGRDNATALIRALETMEGIHQAEVMELSLQERLSHVIDVMNEARHYVTRH